MPRKERLVVGSGIAPPSLVPRAGPVSQYVRPPGSNRLSRLAEGLTEFAPGLARLSVNLRAEQAEQDAADGEARARAILEESKTYREAIEEGLIRPDQSPHYRSGAERLFGFNAANAYAADLALSVEAGPLSEATDLAQLREHERQFRAAWKERNFGSHATAGGELEAVFGRTVDNAVAGMERNWAVRAGANLQRGTNAGIHQAAYNAALRFAHGDGTPEQAAGQIRGVLGVVIEQGTDPQTAFRGVADGIVAAALRANDPELLNVLDLLQTDAATGATLAGLPEVAKAREDAEERLAGQIQREWQATRQREEQQREDRVRGIESAVIARLAESEDPAGVDIDAAVSELARLDPASAVRLYGARQTVLEGRTSNDPQTLTALTAAIWTGRGSQADIVRAIEAGRLGFQGAQNLFSELEQYKTARRTAESYARARAADAASSGEAVFEDPAYRAAMRTFGGLFGSEDDMTEERAQRRHLATGALNREWVQWRTGPGREAGFKERSEALDGMMETMRRTYADPAADVRRVPGNPLGRDWTREAVLSPAELNELEGFLSRRQPLPAPMVQRLGRMGVRGPAFQRFLQTQRALITPRTR